MKLKRTLMLRLVRWHRRLGLILVLFLVLLATTGILINHSDQLDIDQPVRNSAVLSWYGVDSPDQVTGIQTPLGWFSQMGTGIYQQKKRIAQCDEATFVGALALPNQFILACEQVLFVLDESGQVEEKLDALFGLPVPINGLSKNDSNEVLIRVGIDKSSSQVYKLNLEMAQWAIVTPVGQYEWPSLLAIPSDLQAALLSDYRGTDISWERVLLDLHSGRLFGSVGNWLMDIVAVLILLLASSGLRLWWARPARK
ncbi:MAG: PepSY-associated TM helix domain-containing protein [Pseudomonadales bacterium]|nr:PepSY-associated TM helix domain-containing protein [Pseudomonadales bacterium]